MRVVAIALTQQARIGGPERLPGLDDLDPEDLPRGPVQTEAAAAAALDVQQAAGDERLQHLAQVRRQDPELRGHVAHEVVLAAAFLLRQERQGSDRVLAGSGQHVGSFETVRLGTG